MFKKAALFLTLMLVLPTLASAYSIAVKVGSGSGSITPAGGSAITTSGTVSVASGSKAFTITPTTPGYTLNAVYLDNAKSSATDNGNGTYSFTVSYDASKLIRTLTVYFSANASLSVSSSINPSNSGYGYVLLQKVTSSGGALSTATQGSLTGLKAGDYVKVTAVPSTSANAVTNINIGGNDNNNSNAGTFSQTFQMGSSNVSVVAYFNITAQITPKLVAYKTYTDSSGATHMAAANPVNVGDNVTLDATGTMSNVPVTYAFTVNGSAIASANGQATLNTSTPGTYNAVVTINGDPTKTASVSVTVNSAAQNSLNACATCHSSSTPQIVTDFSNSPHWTNTVNTGANGTSCATRCHFQATTFQASASSACQTCHSDSLIKDQNLAYAYNVDAVDASDDGTFKNNSTSHPFRTVTQENACIVCHSGSHHGGPTAAYANSSHYQNPYGEGVVTCINCHNPHSTQASFPQYNAASHNETVAGSCDACHARTTGKPYGIFSSNGQMMQPHTANKSVNSTAGNSNYLHVFKAGTLGWYSKVPTGTYLNVSSSYVSANNSCTACHGHNNQVNGEYADTMHADPYGRWKSIDGFKFAGFSSANATTITHANSATDGCVRCHTTTGFVNFVKSGFNDLRAWGFQNLNDPTGEVITCRACHDDTVGAVKGEHSVALPEGQVRQIGAYPAYYNYSVANVGKFINGVQGATGTALAYRDFKNSNICVPCHSGRSGNSSNGSVINALGAFGQYTTLNKQMGGVPNTPHAVYQAAVLDAKIGYQFSTYTTAANGHATIGVGGAVNTGTTSGPCVTCHMDYKSAGANTANQYRKHNFDIVNSNGTLPTVCASCHSTSFNGASLATAQASFQAAVTAMAEYLASSNNKYNTPIITFTYNSSKATYSVAPADSARLIANTSFTGKAPEFAKLVGVYYNMNLLWGLAYGTTDVGAYAHNPQYLKKLIFDTMNYLVPAGQSVQTVIGAIAPVAASTTGTVNPGFTADQQSAAVSYVNNSDANHYATGTYKVQYVLSDASETPFLPAGQSNVCANCHNPQENSDQASAREAWAESGHGSTTVSPWMPSGSHAWRSTGDATVNFQVSQAATDCLRCHTTDGYAQFTGSNFTNIAPVATAADAKTNSPLACNTCHVAPLNSNSDRRTVGAVSTFYNISTVDNVTKQSVKVHVAATFPDVGESNICISCHSGRVSGAALTQAAANGLSMGNAGFQNSHYMAAAGMMYVKAGFTAFTSASAVIGTSTYGASLTANTDGGALSSTHRILGTSAINGNSHNPSFFVAGNLDTNGPCVTCHMKGYTNADTDRAAMGHSLEIDADAYAQVCSNCHTSDNGHVFSAATTGSAFGDFQTYFLDAQSEAYQAALKLAVTVLQNNYNITYNSASYPYFYDQNNGGKAVTDWTRGGRLTAAQALKLHGACLNINLLGREPGAFAHARTYSRRLLYDTIDFLDDGTMNLSVSATATTLSATVGSPVYGMFNKGTVAYDGGAPYAGGTLDAGTSEGTAFILNWTGAGAWATPERP